MKQDFELATSILSCNFRNLGELLADHAYGLEMLQDEEKLVCAEPLDGDGSDVVEAWEDVLDEVLITEADIRETVQRLQHNLVMFDQFLGEYLR